MQMEPQVSLEFETRPYSENIDINENHCAETTSTQDHDRVKPVSKRAKKTTRQWAAWTRQEEETFFNALRQFGKNFEKITHSVKSKNKDQVRHYYYRLVRRMNKLLGPELSLDAKNSKDTNAAMLRWWSLLEKYSCKSSKLHLKPRRFKIFLETLETQLLKDRKKCKRKRPSQGENFFPTTSTVISNNGRASVQEVPAVRLVLVDSQNIQIQPPNSVKEASVKRNVNVGVTRRNCKSDSLPAKMVRQRRKPASASTSAFKRWEKAAIAGVSLVADAAEHLERATIHKEVELVEGQKTFDSAGSDVPSCPAPSPNAIVDNATQTLVKLKLQLFPIDERTRIALEMDTRNPHLELTLSTRKKISSVLEHLNRKWGNSSVAAGELMLFPYYVQSENLAGCLRWTQGSVLSTADVYALVGSPSVFRLRYGWFVNPELPAPKVGAPLVPSGMNSNLNMNVNDGKDQNKNPVQKPLPSSDCQSRNLADPLNKDQQVLGEKTFDTAPAPAHLPNETSASVGDDANNTVFRNSVFCNRSETSNGAILREGISKDGMRVRNGISLSAGEWADSLTNISVGDLLTEVSHNIDDGIEPFPLGSSQCPQQGSFSCDSFDAAIAAHIYRHQNKSGFPSALSPVEASIWEAEETCDAFSFQKSLPQNEVHGSSIASSEECHKIGRMSLTGYGTNVKESLEVEVCTDDEPFVEEPMDEFAMEEETEDEKLSSKDQMEKSHYEPSNLDNPPRNTNGLTDLYWPDSLGPLDLDIPTLKYHNEDLILSDSLSGFNRLLGNSLDAFQNCSFFGFDKKDARSIVEAQEATSFSDYKVGTGVTDLAKA